MLKKLVESGRRAERKRLLAKIKAALLAHTRADEQVVDDATAGVGGRDAEMDGREGDLEHGLANQILSMLGKIRTAASIEFCATAKVRKDLVDHHSGEEEKNV
jgi:hypothetical protein